MSDTEVLSQCQESILALIRDNIQTTGQSPTYRDIMSRFGFTSPNAVAYHLRALERRGDIKLLSRRRSGILLSGFAPTPIDPDVLDALCVRHSPPRLTVEGDTAHVLNRDLIPTHRFRFTNCLSPARARLLLSVHLLRNRDGIDPTYRRVARVWGTTANAVVNVCKPMIRLGHILPTGRGLRLARPLDLVPAAMCAPLQVVTSVQ